MAPRDPKLRPALEVVPPTDAGAPGYRHDRTLYEFLWGDGEWHTVTIRGWRKDARGRQVVDVEFHAAGGTWSESYLYDPAKVRDHGG